MSSIPGFDEIDESDQQSTPASGGIVPDFDEEDEPDSAVTSPGIPDFDEADDSGDALPDFDEDADSVGYQPRTGEDEPLLHALAPKNPGAHTRRIDPYWGELWTQGSQATWTSIGELQRRNKALDRRMPAAIMDYDEAVEYLRHHTPRHRILAMLSLLDSWGAMTAEQLVAFTGAASMRNPKDKAIMALFSAGLINVGRLSNAMENVLNAPHAAIYQGRKLRTQLRRIIKDNWTAAEYLQVDGGPSKISSPGWQDRHNILASELCLRAAESLPEATMIFGERWSSTDSMYPHKARGIGQFARKAHQMPSRGDGTIILNNGMRVVIEVHNPAFLPKPVIDKKVMRWAKHIADNPLKTSGLMVLFVSSLWPEELRADGTNPAIAHIMESLRRMADRYPGKGPDSPASRIGVASWHDLFPAEHEIAQDFYKLTAEFVTGTRSIIDDDPNMDPAIAEAPMKYGQVLAATPHWLRRGDHTHLIGLPTEHSSMKPVNPLHMTAEGSYEGEPVTPPQRLRVYGPNRPLRAAEDWNPVTWFNERAEERTG